MDISVFQTPDQLALAAAERFVELGHEFHGEFDRFNVALSGGNTPRRVYELLATERFKNRVGWHQVHFFFGDERMVPPDHPESNYRMAYEALLSEVPIPAINVHRIVGEGNAEESARRYENELRTFFAGPSGSSWPKFDLIFLGMGADGHTASLFPGSDALQEKSRWVVATKSEQSAPERITLTLPVFNHAANVMFLVTGKEKAQRLSEVLHPNPEVEPVPDPGTEPVPDPGAEPVPARMVQPIAGRLEWFVDSAAASML
jgi:6-phosphogluconolactonase